MTTTSNGTRTANEK